MRLGPSDGVAHIVCWVVRTQRRGDTACGLTGYLGGAYVLVELADEVRLAKS